MAGQNARLFFGHVSLATLCLSLVNFLAQSGHSEIRQTTGFASEPVTNLGSILDKMEAHRRMRDQSLTAYSVERTYKVSNKRVNKQAAVEASMIFLKPGEKLFEVRAYSGSGFMRKGVLNRLIETERQSAREDLQAKVAISPDNYSFEFLRRDTVNGRLQYVLRARPRRKHDLLFDGTIWVDGEDFAVTRIEGRPAKNPSFWTRKIEFVHEYVKVDAYWFPKRNTSVASVLIFGPTTTEIEYRDYQLNRLELLDRAAELRKRGATLEIQIDPKDRKGASN